MSSVSASVIRARIALIFVCNEIVSKVLSEKLKQDFHHFEQNEEAKLYVSPVSMQQTTNNGRQCQQRQIVSTKWENWRRKEDARLTIN